MPLINENAVQSVAANDDEPIQYFVSSCLTVTCGFGDGTRIGAHFSHGASGTNWAHADSVATWTAFTAAVTNKRQTAGAATWVTVRGQIDMWQPTYLTTARMATDFALRGDLTNTITAATGHAPNTAAQNNGFIVMGDGSVIEM
jgi:hypothetical protein